MGTPAKGVTGRDTEPQHMKDQTLPRGESVWTCLASHRAMGVWVGGVGNTVPGLLAPLVEGWGWGLGLKLKENNQQRCSFCPPAQRLSLLIQSALSRVFNPSFTQQLLLRSPDFPQNFVWFFATLWTEHARLPCPTLSPGAYSNSCPLSWWCHPTTSSSVVPFSSCLQSFPASVSFLWVASSHQVAKILELQHQSFQWIFRVDFS